MEAKKFIDVSLSPADRRWLQERGVPMSPPPEGYYRSDDVVRIYPDRVGTYLYLRHGHLERQPAFEYNGRVYFVVRAPYPKYHGRPVYDGIGEGASEEEAKSLRWEE